MRETSDVYEHMDEEDSDPADPALDAEDAVAAEPEVEAWESCDFERDDSFDGFDAPRVEGAQAVARCLPPIEPRAQWRVRLAGGDVVVESIGRRCRDPESRNRRHAAILVAARFQHRYLETCDIDALRVLDAKTLLKQADNFPDALESYAKRRLDVSSDFRGQYFYAPWGALHAARFLLQNDVCDLAMARVWNALHALVANECEKRCFLKDAEVAITLNEKFKVSTFTPSCVAHWHEVGRNPKTRRLYFPNREQREAAACGRTRPNN